MALFNKKTFTLLFVCFMAIPLSRAQKFDPNGVILSEDYRPKDFGEYLVQLAWANNPKNRVLETKKEIATEELNLTKWSWAESFNLTFNLNEENIRQLRLSEDDLIENPVLVSFPKYNLSAQFNLHDIFEHPSDKRIAELNVTISDHDINDQKLKIRADVLERYQSYLLTIEVLKARTQAEDDAYQTYLLVSDLFKNKEATFEEYNSASTAYHKAKEGRITATTDIDLAKYKVEELIGVQYDHAEKASGLFKANNKNKDKDKDKSKSSRSSKSKSSSRKSSSNRN